QSAREAARRSGCVNNLKQIGVALQNYHNAYRSFPSGYISQPGGAMGAVDPSTGDAGPGWTSFFQLLPFVEESAAARAFDMSVPSWDAKNGAAALNVIPIYRCPSVSDSSATYTVKDAGGTMLAEFSRCNYVACAGRNDVWEDPDGTQIPKLADGVFFR